MKRFNVHKRAARLRRRGTKWEQFVKVAFHRQGIKHLFQYVYQPYIVDFLLFDRNVILEIDGRADQRRTEVLQATTGHTVVRWMNVDVIRKLPTLITDLRLEFPVVNNDPPDLTYGHPLTTKPTRTRFKA